MNTILVESQLHDLFDGITSANAADVLRRACGDEVPRSLVGVVNQRILLAYEEGRFSISGLGAVLSAVVCVRLARAWAARRSGWIAASLRRLALHVSRGGRLFGVQDGPMRGKGSFEERPVLVVIPVYNGFEALSRLCATLFDNTDEMHEIVFVDDASTDARVLPYIESLQKVHSNVRILRHGSNQGFSAAVSHGVGTSDRDFVLLNTDTEVPPEWIPRLFAAIWSDARTASVTPMTCESNFLAVPDARRGTIAFVERHGTDRIDRAMSRIVPDLRRSVIAVGVGFCLAVSRKAWNAVGPFDADVFGRGYGEETDWCLRAGEAGFRNCFAGNLFVAHWHNASFTTDEKKVLLARNMARVRSRHPRWNNEPNALAKISLRTELRTVARLFEEEGLV